MILQTSAQSDWKQGLHYDLHVKLNPAEKSLDARMKLQYTNHSPDTLSYIWFHVWPNAYRNDRTLYSDQLLENGDTRFYFSSKEQKGYINRLSFRVNGSLAVVQDHPEFIDVVKVILPQPLLPGDSISFTSSFYLRLPYNFNGNGYTAHHFELKNWYPEPAVYDAHGWHPMPFLVQGGAYHEIADYNVEIESAPGYSIATGAGAVVKQDTANNLYQFSLANANAFAWVADNQFKLKTSELGSNVGKPVNIQYYYTAKNTGMADRVLEAVKTDMRMISEWLGPYPHQNITIAEATVMQDQNFSGLVCIGQNPLRDGWQSTLMRALLGQWFQTVLVTDQRNQPWFSKGFISFYEDRFLRNAEAEKNRNHFYSNEDLWLRVAENEKTTQPVTTPAPDFSAPNDSLMPGNKAGLWLRLIRDAAGTKSFDQNMQHYFSNWQFKHPYPEDFKKIMDSGSRGNIQILFEKLSTNEPFIPEHDKKILKPDFIFSAKNSNQYNYIGLAPVPGYNRYDGFMLGALIHNINLPENKFEFLFVPLYAFGSNHLVGLGRLSYSWHPGNHFNRISVGINGAHFDTNKATDSTGGFLFENYSKLVPYIRLDFKKSSPRSTISKWMDFKSFLITEQSYTIESFEISSKDSLNHPNAVSKNFRYVNQLSFNLQDERALYPYGFRAELQQSELFYRFNLHANYFLNYADGGGLQVRFFAAKFGVWNDNKFNQVSRYEPKLLGVNGDEDYLYQDYFIGRSASNAIDNPSISNAGLPAQQIMNRDGGLKLRIDGYDYLQGQSANWVTSLNFSTSLPASLFPFPVPIRIFFDFGTYAEAWENNPPTSRFLYTGGIQLSLFRNLLNIYAPLIYSSEFNDALGTVNFGRRITFSIDIQNINYKRIIRKAAGS